MTIIQKFDPEKYEETGFLAHKKLVFLLSFSLLILIVAELWIGHTVTKFSEKFDNISKLQETIQNENQVLENEIASKSTLGNIASESATAGFYETHNIKYIR